MSFRKPGSIWLTFINYGFDPLKYSVFIRFSLSEIFLRNLVLGSCFLSNSTVKQGTELPTQHNQHNFSQQTPLKHYKPSLYSTTLYSKTSTSQVQPAQHKYNSIQPAEHSTTQPAQQNTPQHNTSQCLTIQNYTLHHITSQYITIQNYTTHNIVLSLFCSHSFNSCNFLAREMIPKNPRLIMKWEIIA